ncbi:LIGHT-DEPENDENT SHORT HYPOCOTYLS 4 protein [Spatholobus suberectus]|nr:LIGHT-DEPENDENT SHORT HYPOCOTYLS 4 protein [Spatholobus suberectus]
MDIKAINLTVGTTSNFTSAPPPSSLASSPPSSSSTTLSRYKNQKRQDWNTFEQCPRNHKPHSRSLVVVAHTFSNS